MYMKSFCIKNGYIISKKRRFIAIHPRKSGRFKVRVEQRCDVFHNVSRVLFSFVGVVALLYVIIGRTLYMDEKIFHTYLIDMINVSFLTVIFKTSIFA